MKKRFRGQPFLRFVGNFIPEPNSGCWLWLGHLNACDYGTMWAGRSMLAHRFSYEYYVEKIPEGKCVLHRCDVRCCVNPEHLFLGTQLDNIADMEQKRRGRHPHSENHGRALLTNAQVKEARNSGLRRAELAKKFGVAVHVIKYARQKNTWKDVV